MGWFKKSYTKNEQNIIDSLDEYKNIVRHRFNQITERIEKLEEKTLSTKEKLLLSMTQTRDRLLSQGEDSAELYNLQKEMEKLMRSGNNECDTHQDGYFIVNEGSTAKFFISDLNDGASWDPLKI